MKLGTVCYIDRPRVPLVTEQCMQDCDPADKQANTIGQIWTQAGSLLQKAVAGEATEARITPSCEGQQAGRCALRLMCEARRGAKTLDREEYSVSELGA